MTGTDLVALTPVWIPGAAAVIILLSITVKRSFRFVFWFSVLASAAGFASSFAVARLSPRVIGPLFVVDGYGLFFSGLFAAAGFFIFLQSYGYLRSWGEDSEEFFLLAFLAILAASALACSRHFVSFFLGLETLSVSLYGLIAYPSRRKESVEAGVKYLILASATAAFLLFGLALVYAETGTLDLVQMSERLASANHPGLMLFLGLALMIVGVGFKLAVVPFHWWTPDIYQGAPAPAAALVSTVSKGAVLAFLLRFIVTVRLDRYPSLILVFSLVSAASMFAGNLLALLQTNVKRLLAYSSIAHLGYLLVALLAGGPMRVEAVSFYLVAYVLTMVAAFGVISLLSGPDRDAEELNEYRGLFWRYPWLAAVFTGALLSLAGIPLTAGFLGKFYVAAAGVGSSLWALVILLVINSAFGLYYYLRVIVTMAARPELELGEYSESKLRLPAPWVEGLALTALVILLVLLGVFPSGLIRLVRTAAAGLDAGSLLTLLGGRP